MIEIKKDFNFIFFRNNFFKNNKNIFKNIKNINKYDKQRIKSLLNEEIGKSLEAYYKEE